jgi:glycosyltransferase involved in cell wall biosynthesis
VIVPAYNEEEALPATLKELRQAAPGLDVLVVDDGSADETSATARAAGARVLRLPFNVGVGGAVRTGLRYAQISSYDRAVVCDADGQHDPAGIPTLLALLDAGADLAVGSRFAPGAPPYDVGHLRKRAMWVLARVVRRVSGQELTDVTSGFRAFDRPVIELLAREYPAEYLADTVEVLLIVHAAGLTIAEAPVAMRARAAGRPSSRRFRLVFDFSRLLVGILSSAYRQARPLRKDRR